MAQEKRENLREFSPGGLYSALMVGPPRVFRTESAVGVSRVALALSSPRHDQGRDVVGYGATHGRR